MNAVTDQARQSTAQEIPWHAAYPEPRPGAPATISCSALLQRFEMGQQAGKDFLVIDTRRNDHDGGFIRGSLNLPAQSLYPSLSTLLSMVKAARYPLVIWHCQSSKGRGTRAANWFRDLLEDEKIDTIQSVILEGGIKAWARAGPAYVKLMNEYDQTYWQHSD